jgi:outer membrane immunogenic protein
MEPVVKKVLAGVALAALTTGSAMAADLAVKAPIFKAPPPVVVYNWTGCYIGVNGGGAWQRRAWQRRDNSLSIVNDPGNGFFNPQAIPGVNASGSGSLNSDGFTGGAQVGCNFQSANVVWGVETDFNSLRQGAAFGGRFLYTTSGTPYFLNVSEDKSWLYTLRGRVGLAADRALFYVTGGLAAAKYRFTQSFADFDTESVSVSKTKAGWTVGAGVEAAVFDNWTVKAEYLFARLSGDTVVGRLVATGGGAATFTNSLSNIDLHVVRVGLNYRFGYSPVVAKY